MKLFHTVTLLAALPWALSAPAEENQLAKRGNSNNKYFVEAGGTAELSHYDKRYFKEPVPYEQHRVILELLIKSYLEVFDRIKAETWIAHGTLLGWWWNGKIMPWDYDLDVQVSTATLRYLGEQWNLTEHEWSYTNSDGVTYDKKFLLDVNPHHVDIDRGDGMNIIDARWIDMDNGAYVDITGLAERDAANNPGIWSCKNYHKYKTTELYPMRVTEYEGVKALVPYSFERILIAEYGTKSLVTTEWQGHRWEPDQKEWVKTPEKLKEEEEKRKEEEKKD